MAVIFNNVSSSSITGRVIYPREKNVVNLTAGTALIKTGNGIIAGLTVGTHAAGIIDIYDGTSSAGSLMHSSLSFSLTGANVDLRNEIFTTGLFVNLTGTGNVTIQFN
jgi:hypothetical protein